VVEQGQQVGRGNGVEVRGCVAAALQVGRLADHSIVAHPAEVEGDGGAVACLCAIARDGILKCTARSIVALPRGVVYANDGRQYNEEVQVREEFM
jgi:hypothetical protein